MVIGNSGTTANLIPGAKLNINSTDSILLPTGSTAQRPYNAGYQDNVGMFRYNTTLGYIEFCVAPSSGGTPGTWNGVTSQFTLITDTQFNGTGSQTNFTVANLSPTSATIVSINGVMQIPTLAYSCFTSNNALIFTEAPASTDVIDVRCLVTTQSITAISSVNGYMQFNADNNGAYIQTGTSTATTTTTFNTSGAQVSSIPNVTVSTSGVATTIDSLSTTAYSSAKYVITALISGTNVRETTELLVVHNGTTANLVTYGVMNTSGNSLTTWSATVSSGNVLLQATATNNNTIYRMKKDYLAI